MLRLILLYHVFLSYVNGRISILPERSTNNGSLGYSAVQKASPCHLPEPCTDIGWHLPRHIGWGRNGGSAEQGLPVYTGSPSPCGNGWVSASHLHRKPKSYQHSYLHPFLLLLYQTCVRKSIKISQKDKISSIAFFLIICYDKEDKGEERYGAVFDIGS